MFRTSRSALIGAFAAVAALGFLAGALAVGGGQPTEQAELTTEDTTVVEPVQRVASAFAPGPRLGDLRGLFREAGVIDAELLAQGGAATTGTTTRDRTGGSRTTVTSRSGTTMRSESTFEIHGQGSVRSEQSGQVSGQHEGGSGGSGDSGGSGGSGSSGGSSGEQQCPPGPAIRC